MRRVAVAAGVMMLAVTAASATVTAAVAVKRLAAASPSMSGHLAFPVAFL